MSSSFSTCLGGSLQYLLGKFISGFMFVERKFLPKISDVSQNMIHIKPKP